METADDPPAYLPARDMETITLRELLNAARMTDGETLAIETHFATVPEVDGILGTVYAAVSDTLGDKTLKDLVRSEK